MKIIRFWCAIPLKNCLDSLITNLKTKSKNIENWRDGKQKHVFLRTLIIFPQKKSLSLPMRSIFNIFFILSSDLWSVSPGGSLEVSHIKIWWFSFFDFTWVNLENTWKSKIENPFSVIVIHNWGTWKFNTVFSMGIQTKSHGSSV